MDSALELPACELGKPAFDLIDPGAARGREVKVEARVLLHPRADERQLFSAVVVEHNVHIEVLGDRGINGIEKPS